MVEKARRGVDATVRAAGLRRALSLWHGPALDGAGSDLLRTRVAANLDELRMQAIEAALDAELACGRRDRVVCEARRLIAEHPLREAPRARLSLALYRSGRQDEALAGLALVRRRLAAACGRRFGRLLGQLLPRQGQALAEFAC